MIRKISSADICTTEPGWHADRYPFSYRDCDYPGDSHFGVLRADNDLVLDPEYGFDTQGVIRIARDANTCTAGMWNR